jgi:hypothetical protein
VTRETVKECSNCEGSGWVTRWGFYGEELPAQRVSRYPKDKPCIPRDEDGEPRPCEVCKGSGMIRYANTK